MNTLMKEFIELMLDKKVLQLLFMQSIFKFEKNEFLMWWWFAVVCMYICNCCYLFYLLSIVIIDIMSLSREIHRYLGKSGMQGNIEMLRQSGQDRMANSLVLPQSGKLVQNRSQLNWTWTHSHIGTQNIHISQDTSPCGNCHTKYNFDE